MHYMDRNMSIGYLQNQIGMTYFVKERDMKLEFTFKKYNSVFVFKILMFVYVIFISSFSMSNNKKNASDKNGALSKYEKYPNIFEFLGHLSNYCTFKLSEKLKK